MTFKLVSAGILATALTVGGGAWAEDYTSGPLTISNPFVIETLPTAMAGAGYLMIHNNGDTADNLLGVEADFPRVMLHTTEMKNDVAVMMHVDQLSIPAGGHVMFEPGGMHVMFMGLNGDPFEVGETIPATLIFEHAGRVDITFSVKTRAEAGDAHMGH